MQRQSYDQVVYWVVGALMFYVLSVGPAVRLCDAGFLPNSMCAFIYAPLGAVVKAPVIGPALIGYVKLWNPALR